MVTALCIVETPNGNTVILLHDGEKYTTRVALPDTERVISEGQAADWYRMARSAGSLCKSWPRKGKVA